MTRRSPPRKVTYFEPVPPRLARNTIIESTFEVGRRFRCRLRSTDLETSLRDPGFEGSSLEGDGFRTCMGLFPVKWLFVVFASSLFGAGGAVLHPVACDQVSRSARKRSRDRNASKAWRLAA